MNISDNTDSDLKNDIIGPIIIEEYKEQLTKRMEDVGCMNSSAGYPSSVNQNFEGYPRTQVDLIADDIRLVLNKYNSSFSTSELQPGINTFKEPSEALFNILGLEYLESSSEIFIEFDYITRKTKIGCRIWYYSHKV